MSYRYCAALECRIDEKVCFHNLETGKCQGTFDDCSIRREVSETETERRREHARKMGKARKGTTRKPREINDTDTGEEVNQ